MGCEGSPIQSGPTCVHEDSIEVIEYTYSIRKQLVKYLRSINESHNKIVHQSMLGVLTSELTGLRKINDHR